MNASRLDAMSRRSSSPISALSCPDRPRGSNLVKTLLLQCVPVGGPAQSQAFSDGFARGCAALVVVDGPHARRVAAAVFRRGPDRLATDLPAQSRRASGGLINWLRVAGVCYR
jgi:hypothetical protein